jgi:hypothetical protein
MFVKAGAERIVKAYYPILAPDFQGEQKKADTGNREDKK